MSRFRTFFAGSFEYPTMLAMIHAAEVYTSSPKTPRWVAVVKGVLADGEVGAGALVPLGELVAEGGEVSFTGIEPWD